MDLPSSDSPVVYFSERSQEAASDDSVSPEAEVGEYLMEIPAEKEFISFGQVRLFLFELFDSFGIRARGRDTKYACGISREEYCEEQVAGRKYECCVKGCKWQAWFRKKNGAVSLGKRFHFIHNHALLPSKYPSERGGKDFTSDEVECLERLRVAKCTTQSSMVYMGLQFKSSYDSWAIRNFLRKGRPEEIRKDPEIFIDTMSAAAMAGTCSYAIHATEDQTWDMIFIGLKEGLEHYLTNGQYFSIDATASTNRYGMQLITIVCQDFMGKIKAIAYSLVPKESMESYAWTMRSLKSFFGDALPVLVISDNHCSIGAAVSTVFPNAHHRLCWKHMLDNIRTHIKDSDVVKSIKALKVLRQREDAYAIFDTIVETYGMSESTYMQKLRSWLPKWCDGFLPTTFLGRRNTTSINESQHARLKRTLDSSSTLVDVYNCIFECKKAELSDVAKRFIGGTSLVQRIPLSPLAKKMLNKEVNAAIDLCETTAAYGSSWIVKENVFNMIQYEVEMENEDEYVCSCKFPTRTLLPCRHIISVLSKEQQLPQIVRLCDSYWFVERPACSRKTYVTTDTTSERLQHEIEEGSDIALLDEDLSYAEIKALMNHLFTYRRTAGFHDVMREIQRSMVAGAEELRANARAQKCDSSNLPPTHGRPPPDISYCGRPIRKRIKSSAEISIVQRARKNVHGDDYV